MTLKDYLICPALAYFEEHYGKQVTPSMEEGKEIDVVGIVEKLIRKEKIRGRVLFQEPLKGKLGRGVADAIIVLEGEVRVVEVKAFRPLNKRHHVAQATFYCLLAEEKFQRPCSVFYLCYQEDCERVRVTLSLKRSVEDLIEVIEENLKSLPKTRRKAYCNYCHFSGVCPWS